MLAALLLVPSSPDTPTDEVAAPAITATPTVVPETQAGALASVASVYGVFRRPSRATDRVRDLDAILNRGRPPAHTRPGWSKTFYRPAPLYSLLVPDGVESVDVQLKSGKVVTKRVQDNAVLFTIKGLNRIVWRDADGTRHSTRAAI
jgi:hypothetical protein